MGRVGANAEDSLKEHFVIDPTGHIRLVMIVLEPQKTELRKVIIDHGACSPGPAAEILFCSSEDVIILQKTQGIVSCPELPAVLQVYPLDIETILVSLKTLN